MIVEAGNRNEGERKLESLGLDIRSIHDALLYGHAERETYTSFDAPGAGEYARWTRQIRRLSEVYVPQGWTRINPDNQPTIVHPSNRHSLVVASGNVFTGTRYATPSTKNPRGRSIRTAVDNNAALVDLAAVDPALAGLKETWMLLSFHSPDGKIYSEVSLPNSMSGEFISGWHDRILIPPVDPDGGESDSREEEPPSYDFAVVRK